MTFRPIRLELGLGVWFRVRVKVPLTRLLFFEIEPKVVKQKKKKNRTKRRERSVVERKVVGRKDHPPIVRYLK